MTRKDYKLLASILGQSFADARATGGEEAYTLIYDTVYTPLVIALRAENENFDQSRFSYACAVATAK